eukprot:EC685481.1.p2 GENE.EC685481.1~~EC685481.1.p2  ORF type:complete len:159 (+),score=62.09 EC685481.1:93-569(+)
MSRPRATLHWARPAKRFSLRRRRPLLVAARCRIRCCRNRGADLGDEAVLRALVDPGGLFQLTVLFPNYFEVAQVNDFMRLARSFDCTGVTEPDANCLRAGFYFRIAHFLDVEPHDDDLIADAPLWKTMFGSMLVASGGLVGDSDGRSLRLSQMYSGSQ